MFSSKENVNNLTAMLISAGIKDIVVCPGSRNAVLVHNFYEASLLWKSFRLHSITDERSASFFAIGIWLATKKPVAICVTSGSALLNTIPGVAEACYRHIPLVIISADRPPQWIGQLDGQTIIQPDALYPYAHCIQMDEQPSTVTVPAYDPQTPLHINVPISEPLFDFNTKELPTPEFSYFEQWPQYDNGIDKLHEIAALINKASLPAVIVGQYEEGPINSLIELDKQDKLLLLPEIISNQPGAERTAWIESVEAEGITMPDLIIHIGGALVNKWLKIKLRQQSALKVIRVDQTDETPDTFSHLEIKVKYNEAKFFDALLPLIEEHECVRDFKKGIATKDIRPSSAKEQAISALWHNISNSMTDNGVTVFLGNSTAVRAASRSCNSGTIPIYCNRGINGIEGSLSVAAGYSVSTDKDVYAIVGDLSFFYDVNALWNPSLKGNLHLLLLNDHRGGIFSRLPGLSSSPALDNFISGQHDANAYGIAISYGCSYLKADTNKSFLKALKDFIGNNDNKTNKPVILEYDTNLEQDQRF